MASRVLDRHCVRLFAVSNCHRLGAHKQQACLSYIPGGWESKIKASADLGSGEIFLFILISVPFQGKSFSVTVIQVYAPTSNAEEAEVEQFYEDLQDLLELTAKKERCPFHYRELECKSRKSRDTWSDRQIWPWSTK